MKHFLLIIIAMLVPFGALAANTEKDYKKLVEKHDVADEAKQVENNHSVEFWKATLDNNEVLAQLAIDLKKDKGAEKEAIQKFAQVKRFYPQYEECVVDAMQGFCDSLLIYMGIADLNMKCSLHLVYSDEVNAFTALTEDGFAMCITTALFRHKGVNIDMLMGFVAHEFAHGALMHHMSRLYAVAKERRKNKLMGGISAGLNTVATAIDAYTSAITGVEYDSSTYEKTIEKIARDVKISTLQYSFQFSREQEYEADLVAFRFMQNLGNGEAFINGLRMLGTEYDDLYSDYSDHPTITSRIAFLKYVEANPQLGNTENAKLQKKRADADLGWD
jgi:hypothetical protein